jgi:CDP-diglyceride synthetase
MGWFFINIVLPVAVPAAFMLLARSADLPPEVAARTSLLTLVQDGQLGWPGLVFSASCAYDVFAYLVGGSRASPIDTWLPVVMTVAVLIIAVSGFLATLGTLYPRNARSAPRAWQQRYKLLVASAVCAGVAAILYSVVHYYLPPR